MSETVVRGVIGQPVTLPCSYRVAREKDISDMCWGRGPCPNSKCSSKLLHTTRNRVTFRTSQRYNLQGYISYGDVSLTIQDVKAEDAGTYCCRVEIPGWFNDIKKNIQLVVLRPPSVKRKPKKNGSKSTKHPIKTTFAPQTTSDLQGTVQTAVFLTTTVPPTAPAATESPRVTTAYFPPIFDKTASGTSLEKMVSTSALPDFSSNFQAADMRTEGDGIFYSTELIPLPEAMNTASETVVRGVIGQPVTLPCSYRVAHERDISDMCWGRGPCPNSKCNGKLLHTTGSRVTFRTSQRYNLQGYISYGDVSLTIQDVKAEDAGTYCCRVEIPGWFNDIKKNIQLAVIRVTTEFPSILLTADRTEEANSSLLTDDVPTVATALPEPTTLQTPKLTLGPSETSLSSASNTEKAGMKLSFPISTILTVSLIGISIILMLIVLSLLWKRRHTRKFIMKSSSLCFNVPTLQIRKGALKHQSAFAPSVLICAYHYSLKPAEDLEKVFSGSEGENNLFVL
ncbi:hypothetical protein CIB84_002367 [Bambusicola thoracicus]|uniref:Ig-like domain-containing protein n=1 Tax=Bambusicola thoracicus TaxID=9083 RepID=A0A2P4TBY4_BAMTH|nr:hypothetical protein CIB84_002367 [Bambusicola thoracicus]